MNFEGSGNTWLLNIIILDEKLETHGYELVEGS